jgi:hypothetical protein
MLQFRVGKFWFRASPVWSHGIFCNFCCKFKKKLKFTYCTMPPRQPPPSKKKFKWQIDQLEFSLIKATFHKISSINMADSLHCEPFQTLSCYKETASLTVSQKNWKMYGKSRKSIFEPILHKIYARTAIMRAILLFFELLRTISC